MAEVDTSTIATRGVGDLGAHGDSTRGGGAIRRAHHAGRCAARARWLLPWVLLAGCTGSSAAPLTTVSTAPSMAAVTTTTTVAMTVPESTAPAATVVSSTAPPTTTAVPMTIAPPGRVAVTGEPFLVDIPGKMIDYVPDVAAKAGIDVPGQYYEILPKFFVFIPSQRSDANRNIQTPEPEDKPILEAYVRAMTAVWSAFLVDPNPVAPTPEMEATFTKAGVEPYVKILKDLSSQGVHTTIRDGNISVPWVEVGQQTSSFGLVLDCGWLDQYDAAPDGNIAEDWDEQYAVTADVVLVGGRWLVDRRKKSQSGCL